MTGPKRAGDRRSGAKYRAAGVLRAVFGVLFAGTVLAIAVYFALHVRPPQRLEPDQKPGVPDTVPSSPEPLSSLIVRLGVWSNEK